MNNTAHPGWVAHAPAEPPGWVKALAIAAGSAAALWATWCSVIALIGGIMPLVGYRTDGDVLTFLLMLFIGEPILIALAYWTVRLISLPATRAAARRANRAEQ
ncbi:hypothetical protein ACWCQN_46380 [Streptomyces sp. NPDC001984]